MISIVLPISRRDYLKPVFDSLAALEKPSDTELIILTDGDKDLEQAVDRRLDSLSFRRITVLQYSDGAPSDRNERRYRIADIHNTLRHHIPDRADYVFSIEDDTVVPTHALRKLTELLAQPNVAYASGVELGRWNTPYLGAWLADDINKPSQIHSYMPALVDGTMLYELDQIDAGGLYCALIDADLYKMHQFEPFDKQGKNGLGCDVNFGLYLRQQGYKCYIDWSVQCDHIGEKGSVNLGNTKPVQVQFTKDIRGRWFGKAV